MTQMNTAVPFDLDSMKTTVTDAIEDIKGFDITVMDVRKLTSMTS